MFDGILPSNEPSDVPNSTQTHAKVSLPVMAAFVLALLGVGLTLLLPNDASEGFHIEFIAP